MDWLLQFDWEKAFVPDLSLLETFIRGTVVYLTMLCLLRLSMNRQSGNVGVADLLVVVLIADAAQNAMANEYTSIMTGILLVSVILFWCFILDWMAYCFPWMADFIYPPPLKLVHRGKLLRQNMRKELITEDELMSKLRKEGIEDIRQVKDAFLEGDGHVSAITFDKK
jgi:uncharacterized membrane protein YcaP (DUF421 family)